MAASGDPFGLVGQLLDGQFRVDALVGEGGFSAVYRGTHVGLGEPIAIKCLKLTGALAQMTSAMQTPLARPASADTSVPPTPIMPSVVVDSFVKRFRDESRILYRLAQDNLNIVRCIASGTTLAPLTGALVPYMVLEWLEGRSLEQDLDSRNHAPRSLQETMSLLEPVFDAMAHAHSLGVIHRDLSVGNIFLAKTRDGTSRAKVLDFGVAKVMTDDLDLGPRTQTLAQIKIFSPAYAAPEQFDSRLSPAGPWTDVYSLALLAVEVLVGRTVRLTDDQHVTLGDMMHRALDPNSPRTPKALLGALGANIPDSVEQVFARALSLDGQARQKDAGEFWRELRGAVTIAPSRMPMDLKSTTRQPVRSAAEEKPPSTERMPPALKSTVRMPSAPPPAPVAATPAIVPTPSPSASQLFQAAAVPPPPHIPIPMASGSFVGLQITQPSVGGPQPTAPNANASALKQTVTPMSARSASRAQWLVGLLVFIFVLAAGGVALRFWILH